MNFQEFYDKLTVTPENQIAFASDWGTDFQTMKFAGYWIGASADGSMIGMKFHLPDGQTFRVSFPFESLERFLANFTCASNLAISRMEAEAKKVGVN